MCNGMVVRRAAMFPLELCKAVLIGFREQLRRDEAWSRGSAGMQHHAFIHLAEGMSDDEHAKLLNAYICKVAGCYVDDLSGQPLDPGLVEEAQRLELEYFRANEVCIKKPLSEAKTVTGKRPISVRLCLLQQGR